jgi:alpha-beta hydrolase superfamily lysophospholipase
MHISRIMTLLLTYFLILLVVFLLQRKMIYFPDRYAEEQRSEILAGLTLQPWPNAKDLRGLMSRMPAPATKGTVLVFHGNAGSAVHRTYYIDALQHLGYRVIVAEYPGYGARPGSPSEAALVEDGIATAKLAWQEFKEPLFLCGESLGSGVVSGIVASKQVPVKGLLLITPFDSMTNVAQHYYWFFLAKWLIRDKFDNVNKLRDYTGNTAVILAEQDEVIPNKRTLALFDALPSGKKLWRFEQAGHNTLPLESWRPWWQEAMKFIDR